MSRRILHRAAAVVVAAGAAMIFGAVPAQANSETSPNAGLSTSSSAVVTITGTVVHTGGNCLELQTASGSYPLYGANAYPYVGQDVVVEGSVVPVIGVYPCGGGLVIIASDIRAV